MKIYGWLGVSVNRYVRKSLIFTLSFTNHSCSFLHISFYPQIHDSDEDQPSAPKLQKEWPLARSPMTIDSASLGARPISGLVQQACAAYGWVRIYLSLFLLFGWYFLWTAPTNHRSMYIAGAATSNTGLMVSTSNNGRSNGRGLLGCRNRTHWWA